MDLQSFKEYVKYVKCPICRTVMRIPKHLPCDHDVCLSCLHSHIVQTVPMSGYDIFEYLGKNVPDIKPVKQEFVCPVDDCKTEITPRNPTKSTYEWAAQFNNNLNLVSLLKICSGELPIDTAACDNCSNLSWHSAVNSVCFTCFQKMCVKCEMIHRELQPDHITREITKLDISSVDPDTKHVLQSKETTCCLPVPNGHLSVCKLHSPFKADMYCLGCSTHCCERCCETIHRKCKQKTKISKLIESVRASDMIDRIQGRLETCHKRSANTLAEFLIMLEEVKQTQPRRQKEEEDSKQENGNAVGVLPDSQNDEDLVHILSSYISRCEFLGKRVIKSFSLLKAASALNEPALSSTLGYILQCEQNCASFETEINENGKLSTEMKNKVTAVCKEFSQRATADCDSASGNEGCISGILFRKNVAVDDTKDETENVSFLRKIMMKNDADTKDCWLTDCCFLGGIIIATDSENNKLKVVTVKGTLKEIPLVASPCALATDEDTTCCVTLPEMCAVQFFQVDPSANGNIKPKQIIQTKSKCYGVAMLNSDLAVILGDVDGRRVAIFNEEGEVLREIHFKHAFMKYLKVYQDEDAFRIFSSDMRRNRLVQFEIRKTDFASNTPIKPMTEIHAGYLAGFDLNDDGNVIFCSNNTGTVRTVHTNGDQMETILIKDLRLPRSVSYQNQTKRLAVTMDSGNQKNYLYLYSFK